MTDIKEEYFLSKNNKRVSPNEILKLLKDMPAVLGQECEIPDYKRNSSDYLKRMKRMNEDDFRSNLSFLKKADCSEKEIRIDCKMTDDLIKRRSAAFASYIPQAVAKFDGKYPCLDIEKTVSEICSEPFSYNLDTLNKLSYIDTACALYILDELQQAGNIEEALFYIPSENDLITGSQLPPSFHDACYGNDVVGGLVYLIQHRNIDSNIPIMPEEIFFNEYSAKRTKENTTIPIYSASALHGNGEAIELQISKITAQVAAMGCRERFDKILSFIRPETIKKATKHLENKMSDYLDMLLRGVSAFNSQQAKEFKEIIDRFNKLIKEEEAYLKENKSRGTQPFPLKKPSVLSMGQNIAAMDAGVSLSISFASQTGPIKDKMNQQTERVQKASNLIEKANEVKEKIFSDKHKYLVYATSHFSNEDKFLSVNASLKDEIKAFTVDNPYEICFAAIYLLDIGSDLPWIMPICGEVVKKATAKLPWENFLDEGLDELFSGSDGSILDTYNQDNALAEDNIEKEADFYDLKYTNYYLWASCGATRIKKDKLRPINYPQFIYGKTGMVLPRNLGMFNGNDNAFKKSGFSVKTINELKNIMTLSSCTANRYSLPINKFSPSILPLDNITEMEELKKSIAAKNEEIAELKRALHQAEADYRVEKKRLNEQENEYEVTRQELIELRELIYKIQNSDERDNDRDDIQIELPYTAKKKIVIFGGHASWLRTIKQLLLNVRFIDPYTKPDTNLIRNADVVWMQSNAMPHSFYNKIMEITRQRKIPVKYFSCASAERCARELAASEQDL